MENMQAKKHRQFIILWTIISSLIFVLLAGGMLLLRYVIWQGERDIYNVTASDDAWVEIADMLGGNMVEVYSANGEYMSAGSGFVISYDDFGCPIVVTNNHVVEYNYSSLYARSIYEEEGYVVNCTLLGYDEYHDVAVIKMPSWYKYGTFIDLLDAESEGYSLGSFFADAIVGESVSAIGNASGEGLSMVSGIISKDSHIIQYTNDELETKCVPVIQTTAAINSGMSGSALFNSYGQIVGLNTYKADSLDDINYSVPIDIVLSVYESIMNGNISEDYSVELLDIGDYTACVTSSGDYTYEVNAFGISSNYGTLSDLHASMGFSGSLLNGNASDSAGLADQTEYDGLVVTQSNLAGLEVGDVIVSINGREIDGTYGGFFDILYDLKVSTDGSEGGVVIKLSSGLTCVWASDGYAVIGA